MKVLFTSAIVLCCCVFMMSCSVDDELPKRHPYLKTITENNGEKHATFGYKDKLISFSDNNHFYEFSWDNNRNIVSAKDKVSGLTMTYDKSPDGIPRITYKGGEQEVAQYYNVKKLSSGREVYVDQWVNDTIAGAMVYQFHTDDQLDIIHLENGNPVSVINVLFDDKENPFLPFWNVHNLNFELELTPYQGIPFFASHNPVEIYRDGVLVMQAVYTYDEDGFPASCEYLTPEGSGQLEFVYN